MLSSTSPPAQEPPPPATIDGCIPPKKRNDWCNIQQPIQCMPPKKREILLDIQAMQQSVQAIFLSLFDLILNKSSLSFIMKSANLDRISALPDDILIEILSLTTIREAAMTASLSTTWRDLWKNVNCLVLNTHSLGVKLLGKSNYHEDPNLWNDEATKFIQKVNAVLDHHNGNGIKTFRVQFPLSSAHASELDHWVDFATASHVRKLHMSLCDDHGMAITQYEEPYKFPLKHFADAGGYQLNELYLRKCGLETAPANLSGFSYLESLSLVCVSVVDSVFMNVMCWCHVLRNLYLIKCHQLINVRTSHAQLVALEVSICKSIVNISINAAKLHIFSYMGHKVDVNYEYAPALCKLQVNFVKKNECPLECIGSLPKLRTLVLQFPARLQVSHALQHSERFVGLKEIVLCLFSSWGKSIRSVAYLLKAAPVVETLKLEVYGNMERPQKLRIRWPENFTSERLSSIRIGGFSGESELTLLLLFLLKWSPALKTLLIDTHPHYYRGFNYYWDKKKPKDPTRSYYARGVALKQVAPKVPSTVKFSIM
ncbi:hypothetical protein EJB05_14633 [Eragrostis curvula]|uniref:Uncharacterized protein n=1 Tax=Eragrostis curvula TaxID=38414 RepID=A0A5J9VZQ5_9POAL|nr:hypothetical protein EJB05_14633 [Eragrostis curvula]